MAWAARRDHQDPGAWPAVRSRRRDRAFRQHLAIGFHGRIDNLAELAASLNATTQDPLDLIAALYLDRGDECGRQLLGDFAIVVIDLQRRALLALRDWIGVRPLFWLGHGGGVAVASEIKQALALFNLPQRPDQGVVQAFIAAILCHIRRLLFRE